ncbi:ABC transporter permease [Sinorhizobium alkalisoli]|uniref:ABC transporter permease n=1 Tax=Sinorhizobium alkalisoli TaxID=1752398 RepID=UPI00124C1334|nr:ABC transporter permease [Sinorhizobium alkalisoli]QFI68538.1 ABC-type antimicrobial peptide transport system, permease component [Sinorhizobium alkalisoli]
MSTLDTKLQRDLRRLWGQVLAIALVVAGGVASLVMSTGSFRSLDETRTAYYERHQFADIFAEVTRAPKTLVARIAEISGVAAVEARIAEFALLDIPNFREPATGRLISLPENGPPLLNRPYMRVGRLPDANDPDEVMVNESFAKAHSFEPGDRFSATLNGRKRELTIVGIALSPELVYAIGPGDRMPDDRRFGVIWMSERALAEACDLDGAFSSVSLKLMPDAVETDVIDAIDDLLERYGGGAAYGRKDQTSHAYLNHGLDMLRNMSRTLPPIFLIVSAFLVNLTLSRLVALEREQIGLLKALGYRDTSIVVHYLKFVAATALIGIMIGSAAGTWLGSYVTRLFGEYYRFPFLVFSENFNVYVLAAVLSTAAALGGALRSLREITSLQAAVAMQPPAPPTFRRLLLGWPTFGTLISRRTMMMLRNIARKPIRAALATLGMAFATGILVVSLFVRNAMEELIDVTYFMADRQDATISFAEKRPETVLFDVSRLPGVLAVEPYRQVPIRVRKGSRERRTLLSGRPAGADLSRIIDVDLRTVSLPEAGVAISAYLGRLLDARVGDIVEVDLLDGRRRTIQLTVAALVEDYFGIAAMMDAQALSRLLREAPTVNGVHLSVDDGKLDLLYEAIKRIPTVAGVALQRVSLVNFRQSLAIIVTTMAGIYTGLSVVIAFGVVYNSARISLSEHARELATLRVLGFSQGETMRILLLELAVIVALAQPPGWAIGYGLSWVMNKQLAGELMRAPLVVENATYVLATAIVFFAALISALVVGRRVYELDLVSVLKTRE